MPAPRPGSARVESTCAGRETVNIFKDPETSSCPRNVQAVLHSICRNYDISGIFARPVVAHRYRDIAGGSGGHPC